LEALLLQGEKLSSGAFFRGKGGVWSTQFLKKGVWRGFARWGAEGGGRLVPSKDKKEKRSTGGGKKGGEKMLPSRRKLRKRRSASSMEGGKKRSESVFRTRAKGHHFSTGQRGRVGKTSCFLR